MLCAQKIGESYRGYVENEVQLDLLLTYHKQQTSSFWGTRQSPSPAKPSTRLMWKSQYVPFDGIPFVNVGESSALFVSFVCCVCVCVCVIHVYGVVCICQCVCLSMMVECVCV